MPPALLSPTPRHSRLCRPPPLARYDLFLPRCLSHSSFHDTIAADLAKVI